ncbi:MAG TPA: hypothetical protein VJK48_00830 [Chlamydiales bacterium]|nr:MAG: hypothetical protein A3F67_11660 [Verrucomicrobia bacterium RIFCSPHIGHO2_12_FULL_41_10]HLB52238.1 hypothetical protein [Chlamydiales bacterium]
MTDGKTAIQEFFRQIIGMKPTRVKLGFGSFITMDFGKDIPEEVKTRQGTQIRYHGEWHLWVYQCAWQIDQNGMVLIHSKSPKEAIDSVLFSLTNKIFTSFSLLNDFFDAELKFEDMTLKLLHSKDGEQWMLFTPENKTFVAGPGTKWDYRDSG